MFHCALHTAFLPPAGSVIMRDELDGPHNDKHGHFDHSFSIELVYTLRSS
jgi:hypothetical protein